MHTLIEEKKNILIDNISLSCFFVVKELNRERILFSKKKIIVKIFEIQSKKKSQFRLKTFSKKVVVEHNIDNKNSKFHCYFSKYWNQSDRWIGKWKDNLFPFHMREGKFKKIISLFTCEKRNWKKSLFACEKKEKIRNSFFLFSFYMFRILFLEKNSLDF